ncbi:MAG TPA: diacylglycerol kinase family protein, partial [Turneriella sp.]|nr:diacylglycerol kinase family protein [Turneriella sp.]
MPKRGVKNPISPFVAVLINPSSAGGLSLKRWAAYRDALHQKRVRTTEYISVSEADFRERTRMLAKKFKRIAVVGGDSSLTIAAEELVKVNYKGVLQFMPAGSVNDIVLDLRENTAQRQSAYLGFLKTQGKRKNFIGQANFG